MNLIKLHNLFPGRSKDEPMKSMYPNLRRVLKKPKVVALLKKANIKSVFPYLFRHTTATYLYGATKDLVGLQKLLGHEDINTTKIYVHALEAASSELIDSIQFD